jgi:Uma2 family endonuclease
LSYYTYGDIKDLPREEKWELVDGIPHLQAQGTFEHQDLITEIATQIRVYLRGKVCRVVSEPAVWLEEMIDSTRDYVIPDVAVVCDSSKIITEGIIGVPDMIVEVLSPSTEKWDRNNNCVGTAWPG